MEKELGEKARRTKEHILAQGMLLMQEKGFRGTSIRDICEATEVSVGTFYAYFKDKGELFRYSFKDRDDSFAAFLEESISGENSYEKIMSFVKYYAWLNIGTGQKELEDIFLKPSVHWFPGNNPIYDVLYKIVKEGQEKGELIDHLEGSLIVDMFRVFMRGCIYEWVMGGCVFDLEERLLLYVGQFAGSLKKTI